MELNFPASSACRLSASIATGRAFWRTVEIFDGAEDVFLLDSGMDHGGLGRWSFAGGEPLAILRGRAAGGPNDGMDFLLEIRREPDGTALPAPRQVSGTGDPFAVLRALKAAYRPVDAAPQSDEPPFAGGLVGWFGYGTVAAIEDLPQRTPDESAVPDLLFMVVDALLQHDHSSGQTTLIVTGRGPDESTAKKDADERLLGWQARLAAFAATPATGGDGNGDDRDGAPSRPPIRADFDASAYRAAVERCREHIHAGDVFEVCLTQRLSAPLAASPWTLYEALRAINPAPFAAFLRLPEVAVVGASPERFLRLQADGQLESRPIKGTRPRGANRETDDALRDELKASPKDLAENVMIVDLVRSDLGRVAVVGSVTVPELQVIETYATVHQMVSTVRARLRPHRDAFDAVRACFPGGSMTGAPKVEAMKIINGLESGPRGVYAGALGYIDFDGAMDLNIVIRTFVCADGRATFGVGGAVTADSDAAAEYVESRDKARALLAALAAVGDGPLNGVDP